MKARILSKPVNTGPTIHENHFVELICDSIILKIQIEKRLKCCAISNTHLTNSEVNVKPTDSTVWKQMIKHMHIVILNRGWVLGDGANIKTLEDIWVPGLGHLKILSCLMFLNILYLILIG